MALLTGMTEDGREVPVQVDASGRLVAEGLQGAVGPAGSSGPAGPPGPDGPMGLAGDSVWTRTGTDLSPKTAGDSVFTSALKVGGTAAAPNITLSAGGAAMFNDRLTVKKLVDPNYSANIWKSGSPNPLLSGYTLYLSSGEPGNPSSATRLGFGANGITDSAAIMLMGDFVTPFFGITHGISIGGTLPASPNLTLSAAGNINAKGAVALVYADNTAAKAGGLVAGDVYRKPDGTLMIAF